MANAKSVASFSVCRFSFGRARPFGKDFASCVYLFHFFAFNPISTRRRMDWANYPVRDANHRLVSENQSAKRKIMQSAFRNKNAIMAASNIGAPRLWFLFFERIALRRGS
jgi:hypothetical protein